MIDATQCILCIMAMIGKEKTSINTACLLLIPSFKLFEEKACHNFSAKPLVVL